MEMLPILYYKRHHIPYSTMVYKCCVFAFIYFGPPRRQVTDLPHVIRDLGIRSTRGVCVCARNIMNLSSIKAAERSRFVMISQGGKEDSGVKECGIETIFSVIIR